MSDFFSFEATHDFFVQPLEKQKFEASKLTQGQVFAAKYFHKLHQLLKVIRFL